MQRYERPVPPPKLSEIEHGIYNLLANLADAAILPLAQPSLTRRRFRMRGLTRGGKAKRRIFTAIAGPPIPADAVAGNAMPLEILWAVVTSSAPAPAPTAVTHDCLQFGDFRVYRDPNPRAYVCRPLLVAVPSGSPLRTIATEPTGRFFCTGSRRVAAAPPSFDELVSVRVRSKAFDGSGRLTVPCEIRILLPDVGENWHLMRTGESVRIGEQLLSPAEERGG